MLFFVMFGFGAWPVRFPYDSLHKQKHDVFLGLQSSLLSKLPYAPTLTLLFETPEGDFPFSFKLGVKVSGIAGQSQIHSPLANTSTPHSTLLTPTIPVVPAAHDSRTL